MGLLDSLGGVVGGLFGGGTQTETTEFQLSPQQQAAQDRLLAQEQAFQAKPFQQFRGPRTAQFGQEFQQGADRLTNIDPQVLQGFRGAAGGLGVGQNFLQNFLGQGGPAGPQFNAENIARFSDPFTQQVIDQQGLTFDRLRDRAFQNVGDEAIFGGFQGGSRQGVREAEEARGLNELQANQAAQLRSQGFGQASQALQNQQQRAAQFQQQQLGVGGGLANLGLGGLGGLQGILQQAGQSGLGIGQILQQLQQQGIDRNREAFGEQRQFDVQNLGIGAQVLGGLPQGQGTRTQTSESSSSPFSQLAGLAGGIFGGPIGGFLGSQIGNLFGGGGGGGGGQQSSFPQGFGPFGGP